MIHDQRESLHRLTAEELGLLLRSALTHGHEAAYWFDRARAGGVPVDDIVLEGLKSENFRTRAAAVNALSQLGERFINPVVEMLRDLYPQVRVAAIMALEKLQPAGEWRKHLKYECYVPAGKFLMGEDKEAHKVSVDAFYIGKYPVTNIDYQRYIEDIGRVFEIAKGKAGHPVVEVSWHDARDYAAWAGMRLLTEAEWEKAAGWDEAKQKKRQFPWGDTFDKNKCNTEESRIRTTTPVGQYSPAGDSSYGVADMAGNVWEWTSSLHQSYPYKADDGREDKFSSAVRVRRGGSFVIEASSARAASRLHLDPYYLRRLVDGGFRVAAPFSPHSESLRH